MIRVFQRFNLSLIAAFALAPLIAYLTTSFLNMSFNRLMQLMTYFGVVLILIGKKDNKIRFPSYLIFYLFFILYVFFTDLYRLNREFRIEYLFSNPLIGSFNIMFIIENSTFRKKYFTKIMTLNSIVLVLAFAVIIVQQVYSPNFFMRSQFFEDEIVNRSSTVRLYSIYSWFGTILSAGFSFVPIFFIVFEDKIKKNKRVLLWLMIGTVFVFLTKQRWVMLNFSLVGFLLYANTKWKNRLIVVLKYAFVLPLIFIISMIWTNYLGIDSEKIIRDRILEYDKRSLDETSAGTRLLAFKAFNEIYWDNPIFGAGNYAYGMGGTGFQDYKLRRILGGRSSQIHVGYLSLLYLYGIIGAIFFLSYLFLLLRKMYRNAKETGYWGPFLGFMGVALNNLVDVNFQIFIMGLIICLMADRYYSDNYGNYKLND